MSTPVATHLFIQKFVRVNSKEENAAEGTMNM